MFFLTTFSKNNKNYTRQLRYTCVDQHEFTVGKVFTAEVYIYTHIYGSTDMIYENPTRERKLEPDEKVFIPKLCFIPHTRVAGEKVTEQEDAA